MCEIGKIEAVVEEPMPLPLSIPTPIPAKIMEPITIHEPDYVVVRR
jgi:hypothetical protein